MTEDKRERSSETHSSENRESEFIKGSGIADQPPVPDKYDPPEPTSMVAEPASDEIDGD